MKFDVKPFVKTILIFIVLSVVWTYFSFTTDRFAYAGDGTVTGFGYLVIFASSFYFGRKQEFFGYWFALILGAAVIFSVASFIIYWLSAIHEAVYAVVNSMFVAWALTALLKKFYVMENRGNVMIITGLCALAAYGIIFLIKNYPHRLPDYWEDIHGLFNIFQLFLIVPLAAGLSLGKKEAAAA